MAYPGTQSMDERAMANPSTSPQAGGNVVVPRSHKHVDELEAVRARVKPGQSFYEAVAEVRGNR